jgi:hypothetical protein
VGRGAAAGEVGAMRTAVVLLAAGIFASGASAAPFVVRASFDASTVEFGAAIGTHVVVLLDGTRVQPDSLRIVAGAVPLSPLSAAQTTRIVQGDTITVAVARTYSCFSSACVASNGDATPALPTVTATVVARDGKTLRAVASWPTLHVRGRVNRADLGRSSPPFLADTTPGSPSYRVTPSTLAWLLDAVAIALALAAAALGAHTALRLMRRRRVEPTTDELERALRLAREAEGRPVSDRRRALGLLARLLGSRDRRLSGAASELAWAKPEPEGAALVTLVADVERELPS